LSSHSARCAGHSCHGIPKSHSLSRDALERR
jgi:hypothetical protein